MEDCRLIWFLTPSFKLNQVSEERSHLSMKLNTATRSLSVHDRRLKTTEQELRNLRKEYPVTSGAAEPRVAAQETKTLEKKCQELESVKNRCDQLSGERDAAASQVDTLTQEKEHLMSELGTVQQELEDLQKQLSSQAKVS